jgi:very-short-patch-repair endonuclease
MNDTSTDGREHPAPVPSVATVPVSLSIEADPTISYAHVQNDVPVVRAIQVTNPAEGALKDVEILVSCDPEFSTPTKLRFERLDSGETRRIAPLDLQPNHTYLARLTEAEKAQLVVGARSEGSEVGRSIKSMEVLAYDQWAGTRALPELLAAFCQPNAPAVDRLLATASEQLQARGGVLNGYQSKNREAVWTQVSALYGAIAALNLQYSDPPASFGRDGQKIRTPDRIVAGGVATCLDLTMLVASCLEQAGLNPIVLFQEGHAWVGCWLIQTQFPMPTVDDAQAVRKRVDSGELLVFETTGLAQAAKPSLRAMHERGMAHLRDEAKFRYAVDIKRARELRILPLPSRDEAAAQAERARTATPAIEEAPSLPPLDPSVIPGTALEAPPDETPAGRLARWKSRLLDMTLRNRMLNFKPAKSNLRLFVPDPAHLEDALTDGREFKVRAMPKLMEGADPRSAEVHLQRAGRQAPEEVAREAIAKHELLAMVEPGELDGRLLGVHKTAREHLEEGGSNTLFLALGFLEWRETEKAETKHRAPLILVPVTMTRQSVHGGFRIKRHDDETIINPTLRQFIKDEFKLSIPALENPPTDKSGLDVEAIWQAVRLGVNHIAGWEVSREVYLANLSFAKYLMWVDLQNRTEQLKQNRVVKHLIDHPGQAFGSDRDERFADDKRLDDTHRPQDILAPLLSDSSQLRLIASAAAGADLVCEGPPGTGKSQSITNLIANLIAQDKTVLFVSEKMAALEVVQRRLKSIGLGPFCLELHSAKASKGEVVKQLDQALQTAGKKTVRDWEREAERLAAMRQELNSFVDLLHREHRNGCNVYDATGIAVEHRQWMPAALPWTNADEHDRDTLDTLRDLAKRMAVLAKEIGAIKDHPLTAIGRTEWSPGYEDEMYRAARELLLAAEHLDQAATRALGLFKLSSAGPSLQDYASFDALAGALLAAPGVPSGFAARAHDAQLRSRVATLKQHGSLRKEIWSSLGNRYASDVAKLNGPVLTAQWAAAKGTWWPKRWFAVRALAKQLAALKVGGERPDASEIDEVLPTLVRLNEQDKLLGALSSEAALLQLDSVETTDWEAVGRHRVWADSLSKSVASVAGGDLEQVIALQERVAALAGEHRSMLAPDGAIGSALLVFREAQTGFLAKLRALERLAAPRTSLTGGPQAAGALTALRSTIQGWEGARPKLRTWCIWSGLREEAFTRGLKSIVDAVEEGKVSLEALPTFFEYSYAVWFIARVMDREPALCKFTGMDHERKIREFREADARFQSLTQDYIVAKLCSKIPSGAVPTGPDSEMGALKREIQRQRGHTPLRKLIQTLPTLLPKLKPCLLMSPLSIAQYLPAGTALFDVVVFDEASQIPVHDAIGAIARGKQLVVVGDSRQLPPTSFFNRSEDDEPAADEQIQDLESVLDELTSTGLPTVDLRWHYRSRSETLIAFSNRQYYDGRLITFPSPVTDDRAVRWMPVSGVYDRGGSKTNRAEAEAIVEEVCRHFADGERRNKTIGIVTFNIPQRDLIDTLLEAKRRDDLELDRRIAEHKDEELFIKNLESVQGDERDIIMFSITYGPDAAGRVTNNFGPLNLEGGHRRLNVAVTRAREEVKLVSTLRPEMINPAAVRARGVLDLKLYLEYAQRGPKALAEASTLTGRTEESPFERAVANALRNKGWTVHTQVGVSTYRIDLAVVDPKAPGRYLLGIEADGRTYHSAASARDRDRLRQHVLEGLGWRIHRVWSTDWFLNHDREVQKMLTLLDELASQSASSTPVPVSDAPALEPARYASAIVEEATPAAQLPIFSPAEPATESLPVTFDPATTEKVRHKLEHVVQHEGPIRDTILYRKVAQACGWGRVGSRIEQQMQQIASMRFAKARDSQGTFFFPKHASPNSWTGFRVADEASPPSRRNVQDVAILELANIVKHLLEHGGSSTLAGISKDVGRLVGMLRVTSDAEARIREAVEHLGKAGIATIDGDVVRLSR